LEGERAGWGFESTVFFFLDLRRESVRGWKRKGQVGDLKVLKLKGGGC